MRNIDNKISEKKIMIIIISVFLVITLVASGLAVAFRFFNKGSGNSSSNITQTESSGGISKEEFVSSDISHIEGNEIVYESDDGTNFSVPDTLRAVYLKPGVDFLLKSTDTADKIKSQIDNAMQSTVR